MNNPQSTGRLVGSLVLTQILGGFLVNFVLTAPLFGPPGFLISASAHSGRIALSALVGIVLGMLSVVIAIAVHSVVGDRARSLTLFLFALATVSLAATVVEQMNVISMLSLSKAYAAASAAEQADFQGLRLVVAAARNSSHYIGLAVAGTMLLVFYVTLFRTKLIPGALAVFGVAASFVQIIAVVMPLFGKSVVFFLLAPLGVCQLVLGFWLLAKGFRGIQSEGSRVGA
ncbi:MAG: DUF4386 domain-containing protein [Opitutaceae bacterium]